MPSEQFQSAYDSIHNTGTRLLQYLREIEEGRRSEGKAIALSRVKLIGDRSFLHLFSCHSF
jgi:hypothetical protein